MQLADGFTRAHPRHAAEVATWLGWALPRGVDVTDPPQQAIDAFTAATGCTASGIRLWRTWSLSQIESAAASERSA
jgi:hypothetical protein